jgi:hypothetical protein
MGPLVALVLASSPIVAPAPAPAPARPSETALSVGLGRPEKGGAMGLGLSLAHGAAVDAPAPGRTRLVYRLEVRTTEAGFPRWIEARLSLTGAAAAGGHPVELVQPEHPAWVAAVACVLRWFQPHDQRVFTFLGSTGERRAPLPAEANAPPRLTLGLGVEF